MKESKTLEFKESITKSFLKTVSAFSNYDGGEIIFGIDDDGNTLNLNADTVAGSIASEVNAEKLIVLTDVPGILTDPDDPESMIRRIRTDELKELIKDGIITGGMIPKVETCINAVENGVKTAHILDGRLNHSILLEIFTKHGIGTMVRE